MKHIVTWSLIVFLALPFAPSHAWSESGHTIITMMAFLKLPAAQRKQLLASIEKHPRYLEDFQPPEGLTNDEVILWRVGRIGYWPDVAGRQPEYARPTWHYELGPNLLVGDATMMPVPDRPGPLPKDATLATQELYVSQAVSLCRKQLADATLSSEDRAIALCWIAHLVADSHQPCHAGSLYMEGVFVESSGDRGANRILTEPAGNMHAFWDRAIGNRFDARGDSLTLISIANDRALATLAEQAMADERALDPLQWLEESRSMAVGNVYTPEILDALALVSRGLTSQPELINLSPNYQQRAEDIARQRAALAAARLAKIWTIALAD